MKTGLIAERLFSGTKSITFDFYENPVFLKGIKLKRFDNVLENQFSSYVEKRGVKSLRFTGFISSFYCFALLFRDYELTHDERSIFFRALQGLILVSLSGLTFMKKIRSKSTYLAMGGSFCILFLQAYMHHVKIVPPYALGNTVPLLIFAVAIGLGLSFNKSLLTNAGMILFMFGGAFVYNEAGYQINLVNILLNFGIATGIAFLDERELRIGFYRLQKVRELNKELEAADKAKLELLSVISHDITGPLTNLNSSIELKDSELLSDKDLKYIFKETNLKISSITHLLYSLTNWAKSQMDGFKPNFAETALSDVLEIVNSGIRSHTKDKSISIEMNVDTERTIITDRNMLSIIIRNILANSIKYSQSGGEISISEKVDSNTLRLFIRDQGKGMSPEECQKLFAKVNDSKDGTHNELGTGLGMYMSKKMARHLNIDISVESEIGIGSSFELKIPLS